MVARNDQDLALSVQLPTTSLARLNQDLALVVQATTTLKARVDQDMTLVLVPNVKSINQGDLFGF